MDATGGAAMMHALVRLATDGGRDECKPREMGVDPGGIDGTAVRADHDRFRTVEAARGPEIHPALRAGGGLVGDDEIIFIGVAAVRVDGSAADDEHRAAVGAD